jgi:4-amino-4-deoxy-L-arabinose transferase-like glycosyltransferase
LNAAETRLRETGQRWLVPSVLGILFVYQAVMYGWLMRSIFHLSVVFLPWLLNQPDYRLYENINIGYPPGYLWLNALLQHILPTPELRVRLGMILIVFASTWLVWRLARRWWGVGAGLLAAASYAFWGAVVMDHQMYMEVAIGLLTLCSIAIWQDTKSGVTWWKPLVVGIVIGFAILIKQQSVLLAAVYVIWRLSYRDYRRASRDIFRLSFGVAIPLLVAVAILALTGLLNPAISVFTSYFGRYTELASAGLPLQELAVLAVWLFPVFLYILISLRKPAARNLLLIGLALVLIVPVYPRYGRFHLSGLVPIAALISAGVYAEMIQWLAKGGRSVLQRWFTVGVIIGTMLVAVIPVYYRVRLGTLNGQIASHVPITQWLDANTDIAPKTRAWILPEIDPTSNFYTVGDYLPPAFWTPTYPWVFDPITSQKMIASLQADPPRYAVVIDNWQDQIPAVLRDHLTANYEIIGRSTVTSEINSGVTFYRYKTP